MNDAVMARPSVRVLLIGLALAIVGAYSAFAIAHASYTLGFDYMAYDSAARHLLAGQPVYDLTVTHTGVRGLYQYPPSSLLIVLPLTLLSPDAAMWVWIAASVAFLVIGCLAMPVRFELRIVTLVLAGTSWPFLYGLRIGQIEALLFMLFALGWRWLDRPVALAITIATGALIKVQPVLLIGWALLTGRFRAALLAMVIGITVVGIGVLLDARLWADSITMLRTISGTAADIGANVGPTTIARQLGVGEPAASVFGALHAAVVVVVALVACRWATSEASFLATVVASQLISPIQWTHYAVMLFLAIAWLVDKRQSWALVAGLVLNMMFVAWTPPVLYLALPDLLLISTVWVGVARNRSVAPGPSLVAAR